MPDMKLTIVCVVTLVYIMTVDGRIFTRNDLQNSYRKTSGNRPAQKQGRPLSAAQQRQRPIFARRGQYERQRLHVPAKFKFPVQPTPPKPAEKLLKGRCSQLTQSCIPQDGCCDPWASCHCHFFNAICFCRRIGQHHGPYGQT